MDSHFIHEDVAGPLVASRYTNFEAQWFRNWKFVLLEIVKDGAVFT